MIVLENIRSLRVFLVRSKTSVISLFFKKVKRSGDELNLSEGNGVLDEFIFEIAPQRNKALLDKRNHWRANS